MSLINGFENEEMTAKKKAGSRKRLQVCLGVLAFAPLLSGIVGLRGIFNPIFSENVIADVILDSNLRFLNGMCIAIGLAVFCILPAIEKETSALRLICAAVFLGGIGRLLSMLELGLPGVPILIFTAMELISPPVLVYWQNRVAKSPATDNRTGY